MRRQGQDTIEKLAEIRADTNLLASIHAGGTGEICGGSRVWADAHTHLHRQWCCPREALHQEARCLLANAAAGFAPLCNQTVCPSRIVERRFLDAHDPRRPARPLAFGASTCRQREDYESEYARLAGRIDVTSRARSKS